MGDNRLFTSFYAEIIQWLIARKVPFDVRFFNTGSSDSCILAVDILPHWDLDDPLHHIYKSQFEVFHYARG